jgi:nucleotide-binding universal stress UspA family protein
MKNVLVATDGSATAERAVRVAAELAAAQGAKLAIINVQDARPLSDEKEHFVDVEFAKAVQNRSDLLETAGRPFLHLDPPAVVESHDRQSGFLHQYLSDRILARAEATARQAGVQEPVILSSLGDAAQQIVAAADRTGADLIVVGRRGVGALAEMLLGSVSQKVLHRAHTNVLTVA